MNKNIEYIIDYSEGRLSKIKMKEFEMELLRNKELREDYLDYKNIHESMHAWSKLEEIENDPALKEIDPFIKEAILNYEQNPDKDKDTEKFIDDSLRKIKSHLNFTGDNNRRNLENNEYNIDEISGSRVTKNIEMDQAVKTNDPKARRLRNFLNHSPVFETDRPALKIVPVEKAHWRISAGLRIFYLSAAALITGFILIRILVPSDNPDKVFSAFYKPIIATSPVIRDINSNLANQYAEAIEIYNQGNYRLAASMFSDLIQRDSTLILPRFFQGITQMELGNYIQAISHLNFVVSLSQSYIKEAQWYLGLAYLKTGEKAKAIPNFKVLSESQGFYQEQAKKILQRLK